MTRDKRDIKLDTDTDKYIDHYKYWNDQMKLGNHTDGIVTPANPELTPIKGFKHQVNGTDYVSSLSQKSKTDIKFDADTDQFVDHYKYWNNQIKIGNHTEGIVTPANPDLNPPFK